MAILNAILSLAGTILGWFGYGKASDPAADERASGRAQGAAEARAATDEKALQNVASANNAANAVDRGVAGGVPITTSDGFRRD